MLKRDSLMAQMQLLGHVLDKVKRQILEDKEDLALSEVKDTLSHYYGMTEDYLIRARIDVFLLDVKERQYEVEELRMLADFLDELAGLLDDDNQRKALWNKVVALYDMLEQEYKVFSFDHISRKQLLMKALE